MSLDFDPSQVKLARFRPKILDCLRDYSREKFIKDLMAGLTVGVVALSLCIGLGVASGVEPQAGLYAGIIGGFLVSLLGGSKVQVGGPAGAFVGLLAIIAANYGFANLLLCTMMAGVMLFAMGLFRLGTLIRFVPQPVIAGFTCGIAITILLTQVKPFFGLQMDKEPGEFLPRIAALVQAAPSVNWFTTGLGVLSLLVLFRWPARWARYVPGSIVVVVGGTLLVWLAQLEWVRQFFTFKVATIGSEFGGIPRGLPSFAWPRFDWQQLGNLVVPAATIAMLGAIESLMSAVVADGLTDDRHDSNQELMGQGVANFVTPLFGGIPVTGVIARTATNIRSGAQTPVAGLVHAVFLLAVLLIAAPLAKHIPLVTFAAVLAAVGWKMGEWGEFTRLKKRLRGDAAVFLVTFFLTVCVDLTAAVGFGMLLACVLFVKRVADTAQVQSMMGNESDAGQPGHEKNEELAEKLPNGVVIYRVFGALLFGAADKLDMVLRRGIEDTQVVIFHMAAVTAMDSTALDRLENLHAKLHKRKKHMILCGPHTQAYFMMEKAGFLDAVGHDNVAADLPSAVERAKALLARDAVASGGKPKPGAASDAPTE
ncbi:SulP family sulfate permease [Ereboglobus sp. PH5-5]|uniref:SulP family inorganic anion transporter n=1 Tax=unclassified Ereboglobus TaxID=2626932 RepID=UPI0024056FE0|nr:MULTISPECIES: SulP family inorganic anion transporter [unclassified Ereboglobus]MDF9828126.1 SulP family sulfate permease [Ereboglobus sp. PH5-10]MDF9833070.1 SulP family sulfate permease [Ereboglobus sp. PH5-5]